MKGESVRASTIDNADYARTQQSIRYRDGKIDGYTSRLHYIADWVNNGIRHGFMEDITAANSPDTVRLSLTSCLRTPKHTNTWGLLPKTSARLKK